MQYATAFSSFYRICYLHLFQWGKLPKQEANFSILNFNYLLSVVVVVCTFTVMKWQMTTQEMILAMKNDEGHGEMV